MPKPKQRAAVAIKPRPRPTDVSDGGEPDYASEQLRKYKAFAATHGYKKTVKRVDDVKANYSQDYGATALPEEEKSNLPPSSDDKKKEYVSDWVSSTVSVTQVSNGEQTNEDSEQKIAQEAEMIAIAQGEDRDSGSDCSNVPGADCGSNEDVAEYQKLLEENEEDEEAAEGSSSHSSTVDIKDDADKPVTSMESAGHDAKMVSKSTIAENVPGDTESCTHQETTEEARFSTG